MKRLTLTACSVVLSLALGAVARAQDPAPPSDRQPAAPVWTPEGSFDVIAASADGQWLAIGGRDETAMLLPTAGGEPILLRIRDKGVPVPKDGAPDVKALAFTPDSQFVIGVCDAPVMVDKGESPSQRLFVFTVATGVRKRDVRIPLPTESFKDKVGKNTTVPDALKNKRSVTGAVTEVIPADGARVLLDRGTEGLESFDAVSGVRAASPTPLRGRLRCGVSPDNTRFAVLGPTGIEIRDMAGKLPVTTVPIPREGVAEAYPSHPALAADGSRVVIARTTRGAPGVPGDAERSVRIEARDTVGGKVVWTTPLENSQVLWSLAVRAGVVIAFRDRVVQFLDLRDGAVLGDASSRNAPVGACVPSADSKSVWVIMDGKTITRMDLPVPPTK